MKAPSGIERATPAAGNANLAPELDTASDCDIGEFETSSASCNVTDSFAASYIDPAGTRSFMRQLLVVEFHLSLF